ncbi:ATP-binding cassette domain-containing protein [Altericroceibacterium spongiae]|uniref:ATP-binding cassette domain-containing protein n=1 Tax=Altericroceibacterium spongiae TaxID=2320269 RepID=A0A420EE28_9SPHN|nr:ATP-binding cassette domain-containing protein [Altericroceibacterium spongiae]RKF18925.1 ATP-binding cassette domain-containing protein [Altericroceibacterium spongiae]
MSRTKDTALAALLRGENRARRKVWRQAFICAALAAIASVVLLGLSGWFLTAAALAGAAGPAVANAFNYMLPSAGIRLLAIMRTGARYGERLTGHNAALGSMARLRKELFHAITEQPPVKALGLGRGSALTRLVSDVGLTETALVRRPAGFAAFASLAAALAMTLLAGWLSALALIIVGAGTIAAMQRLRPSIDESAEAIAAASEDLRETLSGIIDAAPELRCYGLQDWALDRTALAEEALLDAQIAHHKALSRVEALRAVAIALAATLCALAALPAGPALAALAALAGTMGIDGLSPLIQREIERGAARKAAERLDAVLTSEKLEASEEIALKARDVHFPAFLPEPARRGHVAIIRAPSGIGKTSLIEAVIGLRPLSPSMAQIDGIDAAWLSPAQRRTIFAYAPQDAQLLSGTVRDNLRLALPDASEEQMREALRDACLIDVIDDLPRRLDSWIGENGERLSGGERRRLSLARALLSPAPWLLLDEPTAGLDAPLAAQVMDNLSKRIVARTQGAILITHENMAERLAVSPNKP